MNIAIIGAGGVGGYFGARLAQAGHTITLVARGDHLRAIQRHGLNVESILGDAHIESIRATDSIADIDEAELIILGVKAWHIKEIREELRTVLRDDTVILPLQNGVMALDELSEVIDGKHLIGGLCRIISRIAAPGVIQHAGITPTIVIGERDNRRSERIQRIHTAFTTANILTTISEDIDADVWKKFMAICVSGLLAVSRTSYGELRELEGTRTMMIELLTEIQTLAHRLGVRITPEHVDAAVKLIDSFPYDSTSSLTRDVLNNRPSEIEYQNGTVVRLGEEYGIATPVNRFVYQCIMPGERRARNVLATPLPLPPSP